MVSKDRWNPHISAILFFIPSQSNHIPPPEKEFKKYFVRDATMPWALAYQE
jgi:hypothetical protein